ncbi:MAG: nucleoside hydrolase [Actinobacteria bacterium]|nr:nucleoside hydrolase [Actinomycetota bacterium]
MAPNLLYLISLIARTMKNQILNLFTFFLIIFYTSINAEPLKLIFDTDMGNDVDDALALAMLHSLESRGESELLGITLTKDNEEVAPYVDAINTFYGRGEIPIGITNSGVTPDKSRFTGVTLEMNDGQYIYPHDLQLGDPAPNAVPLLRKILANQSDQSVVIVQVGFSTNLAQLLNTQADEHSDLDGVELISRKVKHISIMAGTFAPINNETHLEYNIVQDIRSAQKLAEEWPTPIYWSGFEVGLAIRYPAISIEQDFGYSDRHPIPESYQSYVPTPHERPTWDLTSVLWAIRESRGYFGISEAGLVTVLDDGETKFTVDPAGNHYYLITDKTQQEVVRELFATLVSEPPD